MQNNSYDIKINQIQSLFESKKYNEALKKLNKLILTNPNNDDLLNLKSIIFFNLENYHEAENCIKKALLINSSNSVSYCNYGNIFLKKENYLIAEDYYKKSIKLQPDNLNAILNLANCYYLTGKYELSINLLKEGILINSNIEVIHQLLASNYREIHKFDLHKNHLEIASKINPQNYENFFHLAFYYQSIGNFQEASSYYLKSIDLNGNHGQSHYNYWQLNKFEIDETKLKKIESLSNQKSIDSESKAFFYLIISEYYIKKNSNNFICYLHRANKLKSKIYPFKKIELNSELNSIQSKYFFLINHRQELIYKDDITPIFILGLPRSGSSVVEQILSNVENIYACGEVESLYSQFNNFVKIDSLSIDETINHFKNIRECYLEHISNITNSKIFTDKLPLNFKYLGFMKLLFPNSKLILTKRNKFENLFSIYRNFFLGNAINFSNSINDILFFSDFYDYLIKFWSSEKINFYTHDYSDYCSDKIKSIKNLYDYLEIKFDQKYLDLKTNRPVLTASNTKIRNNNLTNDYNWLKDHFPEFN